MRHIFLIDTITKITYISLGVQLYEKLFPLEAQLANFCPGKCVDFRKVLEDDNPDVNNGQIQGDSLMVLQVKVE